MNKPAAATSMKTKFNSLLRTPFEYKKYSRLGIASFVIALISGLLVITDIALVLRFQKDPQILQNFRAIDLWTTWLTLILSIAGIVTGLASAAQKERKRLFGVIGLIFNGLFLLTIIGLYLANAVAFWILTGAGK